MIKEDYLANLFNDKDKLIKNTNYKYIQKNNLNEVI